MEAVIGAVSLSLSHPARPPDAVWFREAAMPGSGHEHRFGRQLPTSGVPLTFRHILTKRPKVSIFAVS